MKSLKAPFFPCDICKSLFACHVFIFWFPFLWRHMSRSVWYRTSLPKNNLKKPATSCNNFPPKETHPQKCFCNPHLQKTWKTSNHIFQKLLETQSFCDNWDAQEHFKVVAVRDIEADEELTLLLVVMDFPVGIEGRWGLPPNKFTKKTGVFLEGGGGQGVWKLVTLQSVKLERIDGVTPRKLNKFSKRPSERSRYM